MTNNPLKPDDYIQQLMPHQNQYTYKKKKDKKNMEIKSVTSNES